MSENLLRAEASRGTAVSTTLRLAKAVNELLDELNRVDLRRSETVPSASIEMTVETLMLALACLAKDVEAIEAEASAPGWIPARYEDWINTFPAELRETTRTHRDQLAAAAFVAWVYQHDSHGVITTEQVFAALGWDDAAPKCSVCRWDPALPDSTMCATCEAEDGEADAIMREQNYSYEH